MWSLPRFDRHLVQVLLAVSMTRGVRRQRRRCEGDACSERAYNIQQAGRTPQDFELGEPCWTNIWSEGASWKELTAFAFSLFPPFSCPTKDTFQHMAMRTIQVSIWVARGIVCRRQNYNSAKEVGRLVEEKTKFYRRNRQIETFAHEGSKIH